MGAYEVPLFLLFPVGVTLKYIAAYEGKTTIVLFSRRLGDSLEYKLLFFNRKFMLSR